MDQRITEARAGGALPPAAWSIAEVVEIERPALVGWISAMTRDREVAEDLAQESLVRLWLEVEAGRAPLNPAAWLRRVGVNLVISGARHAAVARRHEAAETVRLRDAVPSVEDEAIAREGAATIRRALAELPVVDREIILLAAHGLPRARIAHRLGRSEPAARTRLCRARARLRNDLGRDSAHAA